MRPGTRTTPMPSRRCSPRMRCCARPDVPRRFGGGRPSALAPRRCSAHFRISVWSGSHRGELFGIPPTGRVVRIEGATFTRLGGDGLVVEDVHHVDYAGLMAQ